MVTEYQADDAIAAIVYRDDPVLLLFGPDNATMACARRAAERAGCRIAAEAPIEAAADRLDQQIQADAALVVAHEPSPSLDRLLMRIEAARSIGLRGIIVAPVAMVDVVLAATFHSDIEHLVDPTEEELTIALALACARTPARLHDVTRRGGVGVLRQLSEEAARIAHMLSALSEERGAGTTMPVPAELTPGGVDAAFVRAIIRTRRLRDHYLRGNLFADPAWDMLLDLMAARLEQNRVAVSSLCIAAAVPATTALRWIKTLTDQGVFVRAADPQDGRRVYIELSDQAAAAMAAYLSAVQRNAASPAI